MTDTPKKKPNILRIIGIAVIAGSLFLGFGLPMILSAGADPAQTDFDELNKRVGAVLGGGLGLGGFLVVVSFFVKPKSL